MRPLVRLGAPSPGGLALPDARPTAAQMYAPRGVHLDDDHLVVCDTGNHRVLVWNGLPRRDGQPADVVLGQADFTTEGPAAAGRGPANGLHLPTGVGVFAGRLFVADAWHHRVLIWRRVPGRSDAPPDAVLGQASFTEVERNRGGAVGPGGLFWPFGLAFTGGTFLVADTGNRRVLGWHGLPDGCRPADFVLGQGDLWRNEENRGGPPGPNSFRWPHGLAGTGTTLYVADAGNHRVLGWSPRPDVDRPADLVLGQPDFCSAREMPHVPPGPASLRFPYAVATAGDMLAVADTANNRVLFWRRPPASVAGPPADAVIGQAGFDGAGENRWQAVTDDSLCWPYGLSLHAGRLAVADSGNNRVMIWDVSAAGR